VADLKAQVPLWNCASAQNVNHVPRYCSSTHANCSFPTYLACHVSVRANAFGLRSLADSILHSPLVLRLTIRDNFDSDKSVFRVAVATLKDLLGADYTFDVPWPLIRDAIPVSELDNEVLVATVVSGLIVFVKKLHQLLEDEATGFADRFLDRTQQAHRIDVKTHIEPNTATPFVRYGPEALGGVIQLYIPRVRTGYTTSGLAAFGADLVVALDGSEKNPADPASKRAFVDASDTGTPADADGFVDVGAKATPAAGVNIPIITNNLTPTPFPTLASIPRPDTLLRQAPYHLIMRASVDHIAIEGHPPSVELIREYLTHHARQEHELEIGTLQGAWGVNVSQLQVCSIALLFVLVGASAVFTIPQVSWARRYGGKPELSKTLFIALVEQTLGFSRIDGVTGETGFFYWKRETPFQGI